MIEGCSLQVNLVDIFFRMVYMTQICIHENGIRNHMEELNCTQAYARCRLVVAEERMALRRTLVVARRMVAAESVRRA